jgi:hypothetical protein
MERSEAEAIYGSGREACVEFLMRVADRLLRLEERLRALEQETSASSRNSSSPPSTDAPKTRQQRRAEAREKAKGAGPQGCEAARGGRSARSPGRWS